MRVLLISGLPEFLEFFGLGHHYPGLPSGPGGEMTMVRVGMRAGEEKSAGELLDAALAAHPGTGPVVAHIAGTTPLSAMAAEALAAREVPFLYSPMLPAYPSRLLEIIGRIPGVRSAALDDLRLAGTIAGPARMILAPEMPALGKLRRALAMPAGRLRRVDEPGGAGPAAAWLARGRGAGPAAPGPGATGSGAALANLAVAFCDALTPEWNVPHFLAAMEKINAAAVVVAGKTPGAYAGACEEQAAANPRIKFLFYEPGGIGSIAGEVGRLLERASIVVDPSLRGLGAGIVAAATDAGVPAVVSRSSSRVLRAKAPGAGHDGYHVARGATFTFEPSSWELLNHAITCAFNTAAGVQPGPGPATTGSGPDHGARNAAIAEVLRDLYREVAAGG